MTTQDAPPALYIHSLGIYRKMLETSEKLIADDGSDMIVYEGFLTHLVTSMALSNPYFTFCRRALIDMGCIRQVKRGGGRSPSQWELIKEPTAELFFKIRPKTPNQEKMGRRGEVAMVKQQIAEINRRLLQVEDILSKGK